MGLSKLCDEGIIQQCQQRSADPSCIVGDATLGRNVILLTENVVVKFGLGVTLQEASAQRLAFQRVRTDILRDPRVHWFFTRPDWRHQSTGYLVMERIIGCDLAHIGHDKAGLLPRIVAGLDAIHSLPGKAPGPVSGGEAHGSVWSESGAGMPFSGITGLRTYLNERLAMFGTSIRLHEEELCLCHMDVAPRNVMIDLKGRLCLLDWATAGFYPRYFELWSIEFSQHVMASDFGQELLHSLNASAEEILQVEKLNLVYRYTTHFAR